MGWDRDGGGRDRGPPPRSGGLGRDEGEKGKGVTLPTVLQWFIGELPTSTSFDGTCHCSIVSYLADERCAGPVFRTEDLMNVFKTAVIPSTPRTMSPPPPPPPRTGK